jgi:hypothetical protein
MKVTLSQMLLLSSGKSTAIFSFRNIYYTIMGGACSTNGGEEECI